MPLLYQSNSNIIKEALWCFSNITAGPPSQVEQLVKNDAFERIFILTDSRNIDIRKESLFVLINAITGCDQKVLSMIYDQCQKSLFIRILKALNFQDLKLQLQAVDAIDCLLSLDAWYGTEGTDKSMFVVFEEADGVGALEETMKNPSMDLYNKCNAILNKYSALFSNDGNNDMIDTTDNSFGGSRF